MLRTTFVNEFALTAENKRQLAALLQCCFPEPGFQGLHYFKQLPHGRVLLWDDGELIGQLGIDYRVMNLNGDAVNIMGVADLCIHPDKRGKGGGIYLMRELESLAHGHSANIDFIFLVTDIPAFYERLGYQTTKLHIDWLKIHRHKQYGIGSEMISDSYFMVKPIGKKAWSDGHLDMLGYMY